MPSFSFDALASTVQGTTSDVFLLVILIAIGFLLGLGGGKRMLLAWFVAAYILFAFLGPLFDFIKANTFQTFPYRDAILVASMFAGFFLFALNILLGDMSRFAYRWWQGLLVSSSVAGLLFAGLVRAKLLGEFVDVASGTLANLFFGSGAVLVWFVLPVVVLAIVSRFDG